MKRALLLGALLLLPSVLAHGAPPPRGYETRLLADCNDDWFGSDASGDGYDLHSLDVQELAIDGEDHIRFRIIMNGQGAAELRIQAGIDPVVATTSGSHWQAAGWIVKQDTSLNDGARFALELTAPLAELGLVRGDKLRDYEVTTTLGGDAGDAIPGFHEADPPLIQRRDCDTVDGEPINDPTAYKAGAYTLSGPTKYAVFPDDGQCQAGTITPVTLLPGEEKFIDLRICNRLQEAKAPLSSNAHDQEFRLTVDAVPGVQLRFHDTTYVAEWTGALSARQSTLVHLAANAAEGSGVFHVTLTTDRGGHAEIEIPYSVGGSTSSTTTTTSESTPGLGPLLLIAALAVASRRR